MFWKRVNAKMLEKPWTAQNISAFKYFLKEFPELVVGGGLCTVLLPILIYKKFQEFGPNEFASTAHKQHFIVMRSNEMPIEGKPYCITEEKLRDMRLDSNRL